MSQFPINAFKTLSQPGHHERYRATYTNRSTHSWKRLVDALLPKRYRLEIEELLAAAQTLYAFDTYGGIPLAEVGRSFDTNVKGLAQTIADLIGPARAPYVIEVLAWILNRR